MLVRKYSKAFVDDGNRNLLPKIELGLGIETAPRTRYRAVTLGAEGSKVASWIPAVGSDAFTSYGTDGEPLVATYQGNKVARFDGVNDQLRTPYIYNGGIKAITLLVRAHEFPATSATPDLAFTGGGVMEIQQGGKYAAWFNGSAADGGATNGTGAVKFDTVATNDKFYVFTMCALQDGIDHQMTLNKEHKDWTDGRTKVGLTTLRLGVGSSVFTALDVAEVILWDKFLTKDERETLYDSFKAMYPTLPIA